MSEEIKEIEEKMNPDIEKTILPELNYIEIISTELGLKSFQIEVVLELIAE